MFPRIWVLLVSIMFFLLSVMPAYTAETETVEFVVRKGDTLSHLCNTYLEDSRYWPEIARLNRLKDPNRIFPNQKLVVPVYMLRGVPFAGVATFVKGVVEIRENKKRPWRKVLLHEEISQGSTVRTGPESTLEITYREEISILLREKSELAIVASNEKSAIHRLFRFFINIGRAFSKINRGTGTENRYEILTPSAVAAARGTGFRVAVDPSKTSRMEVLEGGIGVETSKGKVEVPENHGTIVRRNEAPAQPRMLLPPPKPYGLLPLYRSMPLVIEFEHVHGADHSVVTLSRDMESKDVVRERPLKKEERFEVIGVDDGTYYLHGRSVDKLGLEGSSSTPVPVRVRVNPLPPFMQTPQDGEEIKDTTLSINWMAVSDAVHYHLQIASDPQFGSIVDEQRELKETEYSTPPLDYGTYYFRVSSVAGDGYEGIWSDTLRFVLIPPPPVPPLEDPQQTESEIHLRWKDLGQGITYHMQIARDASFETLFVEKMLDHPSASIAMPERSGTYFVRVRGIGADGYEGSFSRPQTFVVENIFEKWIVGGCLLLAIIIAL